MEIKLLSQKEADDLMKSLEGGEYFSNFREAFQQERDKPRSELWAFPAEKRLYYRVESYLFGINCENKTALGLSSFARIDGKSPKCSCAPRLKLLIEEKLIPLGREQNKTEITAQLTAGGDRVFNKLKSMMPGVSVSQHGFYLTGRITFV